MTINFFWIGKSLTDIGLLSLASFNKKGYKCVLWCFDEINNVPKYVKLKDAGTIIKFQENINPAFLSDYFRYKLLYSKGGIYSDLDNILLKQLPDIKYILSGSIQNEVNSHLIKTPKNNKLLEDIVCETELEGILDINHLYNGIYLLNKIKEYNLTSYLINGDLFNYFDRKLELFNTIIIDWNKINTYSIHLFESGHRVAMKQNKLFQKNMNNLKNYIYE